MSEAPVEEVNLRTEEHDDDEEMPRVQMTRRRFVLGCLLILGVVALLYYGVPRLAGLDATWHRIEQGDPWWLARALAFSVLSFGGYVVLFRYVYAEGGAQIGLRESYEITMASLAATRIFAAGGAGGIALTAWAMRRAGMSRRTVAERTMVFLVLTYVVYMAGMLLVGLGVRVGVLPGPAPFGLTVVPAAFAGVAIVLTLLLALTPTDLQRRVVERRCRPRCATRSTTPARATPRSSARSPTGRSTSRSCGPRSARSARRRRGRSSCSATSSACSATCCRCPAGSAASTAG
jgi:hypothetical protein